MKRNYLTPALELHRFDARDIITTSGEALTDGGENGTPEEVSYEELFSQEDSNA